MIYELSIKGSMIVSNPYENETDYRKIPRQYLNSKIPKGRGIVKWNAFKTMPEQYKQLEEHIENQNKIEKPSLSSDQIETLNTVLNEKIYSNDVCEVMYYEAGYIEKVIGYIVKLDEYQRYIIIENDSRQRVKLNIDMIVQMV